MRKTTETILSNNDSPITVNDTSTIFNSRSHPQTSVAHGKGFGKNAKNHFFIHDKENGKDTYRPACLLFSSGKVPIPASAQSWQITYPSGGGTAILMSWSEQGDANGDAGDITFGSGFISSGNTITLALQLTTVYWSIDGGGATSVTVNRGTVVIVRYCPNGKCVDSDGTDLCK
jgi:hypothetical protein